MTKAPLSHRVICGGLFILFALLTPVGSATTGGAEFKKAREKFLIAISQRDEDAALEALEGLLRFDDADVANLLIDRGLTHDDMDVYRESERMLRRLESDEAHRAVALVARKNKSWELRADCTRILSYYHNERAFDTLAELLEDKHWLVRSEAVRGLTMIREKRSVTLLIERMQKEEGRLLEDIAEALKEMTRQKIPADAERWKSWWESTGKDLDLPPADADEAATGTRKLGTAVKQGLYGVVVSERVAFLLDVSGSMTAGTELEGSRHEIATRELVRVLQNQIGTDAEFNVIAFADEVLRFAPKLQKGKGSKIKRAITFVKALKAGGETNAYGALEIAFADPKIDTIYLLSDGSPTVGDETIPALIRRHVMEWNRYRGVKIHCIGFFPGEARYQDKAEARTFLMDLANDNRGRYTEIE